MRSIIILIVCILFFQACQDRVCKQEEFDLEGRLSKIIYTQKGNPHYRYVETYDSTGFCTEGTEYFDSIMHGKRIEYNRLSGRVLERFYVKGLKHGVERFVRGEFSHERLFLNDTAILVKAITVPEDAKDNSEFKYTVAELKGDVFTGKLFGVISLKGNGPVSVFDLNRNVIDLKRTNWYFDNLPDTIPMGQNVDFEIDLAIYDDSTYLSSKVVLLDLKVDLLKTDLESIYYKYQSPMGVKKLKCRINIREAGHKLITGLIKLNHFDEHKKDSIFSYQVYYKQIFVEQK